MSSIDVRRRAIATFAEQLAGSRDEQWDLIAGYLRAYAVRTPVRKVAVVGNAPMTPDAERAADIDSADLVIRINGLMLDLAEGPACIGRECHIAIVSMSTVPTPWVLHDYRRRGYLIPQFGVDTHRLSDQRALLVDRAPFWPADLGTLTLPNAVLKDRICRALVPERKPGSLIPTTGIVALYLAHEMFPGADLVASGFSLLDDETQTEFAHHAGDTTKVNWQHRLDLEAALLRTWVDDGSMRLLR